MREQKETKDRFSNVIIRKGINTNAKNWGSSGDKKTKTCINVVCKEQHAGQPLLTSLVQLAMSSTKDGCAMDYFNRNN